MKIGLILQGPANYASQLIECYNSIENVFISTLENDKTNAFGNSNFIIIKNPIPPFNGQANFNYQVANTLGGIIEAEKNNCDFVFKLRSDILIPEFNKLISFLEKNEEKIYFSAYHNWDGGYLCEHMLFGETQNMKKLWSIPVSYSSRPPEIQLTEHFFKVLPGKKVDYLFPFLYKNDIKAFWIKRGFYLNECENDKLFTYDQFKEK